MKDTKKIFWTISVYNPTAIAEKLEEMAAEGWMFEKTGSMFWTFKRAEPRKLRFAVTYFPGASDFDPDLTEGEKIKAEYCAEDGWTLAGRFDIVHIYYSENLDITPIDTDPVTQVNTIWKAMKKRVMPSQVSIFALIAFHLSTQFSQLQREPVDYLSDPFYLYSIPMWGLLLFYHVIEILSCLIWRRRAVKAADNGIFNPIHTSPLVGYGLLALSLLCMVLAYTGVSMSSRSIGFALIWIVVLFVILFSCNFVKAKMKKSGWPRGINRFLSVTVVLLMTLSFFAGLIASIFSGNLSFSERKKPVSTVDLDGWTMKIYDDPIPLNIEDLRDTGDTEWSKEAKSQETFLLSYSAYEQNNIPNGKQTTDEAKDLMYSITDVKVPFLFDSIKKAVLNSRQDDVSKDGKVIFIDHFEPCDPSLWDADEAYQLHWSDTVLDTYLVCWGNRIVEVKFFWEATEDEIRTAAEILKGAVQYEEVME